MNLFDIIKKEDIIKKDVVEEKTETCGFSCDTRNISRGETFFAISGEKFDGNAFIAEAYLKGAVAVVTDKEPTTRPPIPVIVIKNIRETFSRAVFFAAGDPQKKMKIIGVTGTNGKTTIATALHKIISDSGKKCALFTTISYDICGEEIYPSSHTTLPPEKLAPLLAEAYKNGAEYAVMEVSSHSLSQDRISAIDFYIGIFTNITRDHLDYHKNIEEYTRAKAKLFEASENSVINFDDERGKEIASYAKGKVFSVSKDENADFRIKNPEITVGGMSYELSGNGFEEKIDLCLNGNFNIYNTAECAAAAHILGIDDKTVVASLEKFKGVTGRMQKIFSDRLPYSLIIDYAHTPDALEKALRACREITDGKLICVFGCGGNRDKGKRHEMGEIACSLSDLAVITSDNPRNEAPEEIIHDIVKGLDGRFMNYKTVVDREKAIEYAMDIAKSGDTVILAGKGHEDYIIDAFGKHHFSETETVGKIIEKKGL